MKAPTFALTPREREVAELVAQGLTNRQIATRLFVAERTAEFHVEQIRNKLGFHARSEIAAWVVAEKHQSSTGDAVMQPAPFSTLPAQTRPSRRLAALVIVGIAVLTAGGGALAWAMTRTPGAASVPPIRIMRVDGTSGQLMARSTAIPNRGSSLASGDLGLWSVSYEDRVLTRINQTSATALGSYGLPAPPVGIAEGGGMVWIATAFGDSSVVPFDPKTNRLGRPVPVGSEVAPQGIAYGWNSVWVTDKNNNLVYRIDPASNTVTAQIPVGDGPESIAIDAAAVWVANAVDATVSRIDPNSSRVVATIGLPSAPTAIAAGRDAAWVAIGSASLLVRIDAATNEHLAIPIDGHPSSVADSSAAVWVADGAAGRIIRIDPGQKRVASSITVGGAIDAILADGSSLWVSVHGT